MSARQSPSPGQAPGPDLLARYLTAYLAARQLSDIERPWGLGDDTLDSLWVRLTEAMQTDPNKLNDIIAKSMSEADRLHIIETLAPLIFAIPLRTYPAELRATRTGTRLAMCLRHLDDPKKTKGDAEALPAAHKEDEIESVGFLPASLSGAFSTYLRRLLHWSEEKSRSNVTISSGGRRRRVRITLLTQERGVVIRFLERLPSPVDEGA